MEQTMEQHLHHLYDKQQLEEFLAHNDFADVVRLAKCCQEEKIKKDDTMATPSTRQYNVRHLVPDNNAATPLICRSHDAKVEQEQETTPGSLRKRLLFSLLSSNKKPKRNEQDGDAADVEDYNQRGLVSSSDDQEDDDASGDELRGSYPDGQDLDSSDEENHEGDLSNNSKGDAADLLNYPIRAVYWSSHDEEDDDSNDDVDSSDEEDNEEASVVMLRVQRNIGSSSDDDSDDDVDSSDEEDDEEASVVLLRVQRNIGSSSDDDSDDNKAWNGFP